MPTAELHQLLKKYWGYTSFRPRQEQIVESIIAGHDTAVVMPTGGGKSLCYQLPAVAMGRTSVVISPLIALMQDQAASLAEMDIPAAFVNSSMDQGQVRDTLKRAIQGEFRLLYISPERAVREDTLQWLTKLPLSFFAIDEAHCISEWGHEFRPEYRQLRILRERFPDVPIAAFTASATRQVRHDILAQLRLQDPAKFVMSFHRPNLRYLIRACNAKDQEKLLVAALDHYDEGNVILYAPTVKSVEETAAWLTSRKVPIVPYHGQMPTGMRERNQELWMSGEKRVLVGTLAFGLGINKPDVRAVIHLAMPKSLEQYYQEAGRAGRDGEPADCVLLWQKRDIGLLTHFVQQVQDSSERERAWQRYHVMRRFVEGSACRHRQICMHFGETPKWDTCGACDICGVALDWMIAPKAVAAAASAESRPRMKPVRQSAPADQGLLAALKEWRLAAAKRQSVPAYVILHDATIEALCRMRPQSEAELLEVPGIGERKAERFGAQILKVLGGS